MAIGGKLGIVKDPFGKLGAPQFIGATLPLDGYGIINLSLSEDGAVLIGQAQTRDDSATSAEDTVAQIVALANDVVAPQSGFAPVVVAAPVHGSVQVNADGSFSYRPDANYFGEDSFSYRLSNGVVDSNTSTVSLSITPVNDAPVAADTTGLDGTLNEDSTLTLNPLAQASDVEGDTLSAQIVAGPTHGSLSVNADGSFSYTAQANYFGTDSFTYKVNDGELDSGLATVSLTVTPVNDAPVASDVAVSLQEDGTFAINLLATDAGNTVAELKFVIETKPAHGVLLANANGSFSYTPVADFNGTDSFTYTVSDGTHHRHCGERRARAA